LSAKHQHHMTSFGSKFTQENSRENTQNIRIKSEINTYYFHQSWTCKNITKQSKIYQEHIVIFWNFMKKLNARGVQTARIGVHIARKSRNWKGTKGLRYPAQTHANRWIWISRTHQGRWIDPDPIGSRSNGLEHGALDRVRTHPVQRLI